jgi:hypothetical protein
MKSLVSLLLALVAATASAQTGMDDGGLPSLTMVVGDGDGAYANQVSGKDWLALACDATSCELEPAQLLVKAAPVAGSRDSTAPQLVFSRLHPNPRKVIAWLQEPSQSLPWLYAGPVVTYGSATSGFEQPRTAGTYELSVSHAGKELARFVPMLDPKDKEFVLQLRANDQRQVFEQRLWQCTGNGGTGYLLWAGDLDRDGNPDYLVNFLDEDSDDPLAGRGYIALYLSSYAGTSRAGDDDLVGMAAEYDVDQRADCPGAPASTFSRLTPVPDTPRPPAASH